MARSRSKNTLIIALMTSHKIYFEAAKDLQRIKDESIDLIVTSPPYPMIEMWDGIMGKQNKAIQKALENGEGMTAFELMHKELDKTWKACHRVLKNGGIACINIGDATRTLNGNFALYPNHARVIQVFLEAGFQCLPHIIWQKPTNAPNKFMGSGVLPPNAYVTLGHEFILIFRKGNKRTFKPSEKANRKRSAYFWEERNQWFTDIWNIKGTSQKLTNKKTRKRSAAFPFEIPYRLINMFSVQGDVVLDPFVGTGTTSLAAMAAGRHSIGFEIDEGLADTIAQTLSGKEGFIDEVIRRRLARHLEFVEERGKDNFNYENIFYKLPVMTLNEIDIIFT